MRIRTIKPGFFKCEDLGDLPALTRLLFVGLWCMADGHGRLPDRPRRIHIEVLPYDAGEDVDAMLGALHDAGMIYRYEAAGERLIQIVNFRKHQRITGKEAETPSEYPDPTGETTGKQRGNNGETPIVQEGKGRERKGKETAHATPIELSEEYIPFVKPDAVACYIRAVTSSEPTPADLANWRGLIRAVQEAKMDPEEVRAALVWHEANPTAFPRWPKSSKFLDIDHMRNIVNSHKAAMKKAGRQTPDG